jgi:hypothetical protein
MKDFLLISAAIVASFAFAFPASAQESSFTQGGYSDVSAIDILDGQTDNYMDYLADPWKRQQEWAKSEGYIQS